VDPYEYIVNTSRDFITLINRDYVYEIVNDAYCREMGRSKEEIVNRHVGEIWGEDKFGETIRGHLDQTFAGKEVHYLDQFKFGPFVKYMHVSFYPYRQGKEITHALVFSHDLTQLGEIESRLSNYEYRDPITGLFNRRSLNIILDKEIEKAKRSRSEKLRAVLFVGLRSLTKVNEIYGHEIGDLLLENTGQRIRRTLRSSDYVFRFEGSQLAVVLTNISRNTDAGKVARNIQEAVAVPYNFKGTEIVLSCAIGIAVYPDDGQAYGELIQRAAAAQAEARRREVPYLLFNDEVHRQARERLSLESDLLRAFEEQQLELHYQPVVDLEGRIVGAEALIRWQHPERGAVPPGSFIPLAEETGIISSIGRFSLFSACRTAARWSGRHDVYVSVNLCARELADPQLPQTLETAMSTAGMDSPGSLKLEVTETSCLAEPRVTLQRLEELEKRGIDVFIDDFGTGYSSLGYLKNLPATTFKIDRLFVEALSESPAEREYLARIIDMIKSRGRRVLVEGVSSAAEREALEGMRWDFLQGFYFARPMPAEQFMALLDREVRLPAAEPQPPAR
jgi:diguanylate cyclase (GGDEF)-like protein/PAS domain S-box-containing protein